MSGGYTAHTVFVRLLNPHRWLYTILRPRFCDYHGIFTAEHCHHVMLVIFGESKFFHIINYRVFPQRLECNGTGFGVTCEYAVYDFPCNRVIRFKIGHGSVNEQYVHSVLRKAGRYCQRLGNRL